MREANRQTENVLALCMLWSLRNGYIEGGDGIDGAETGGR